jgi:Acyltransferase
MAGEEARIPVLTRAIIDEIVAAFNFPNQGWERRVLWPLFWLPAHLFARLAVGVDENTEKMGIPEAARRLLPRFVKNVKVCGAENIPHEGPLVIASNHPGAYDSVAIISQIPRIDLKIVVSDVPFLKDLPALRQHMIYTIAGTHGRMAALRSMIRQVQEGGAVLVFPSGVVDPDPALSNDAYQKLGAWSPSLELIMRKVPEVKVLVTIVSGVLSPACLRSPFTRLPKLEWQKQKLAEFLQVMQQLVLWRNFGLTPKISFAQPFTVKELLDSGNSPDVLQSIIAQARQLLAVHTGPSVCPVEN